MPNLVLNVYLCLIFVCGCHSANILFFFGVSTYSHRIVVWPLVEKLVERGHNVTFFMPHKMNKKPHPKVTELIPDLDFNLPDFLQFRLSAGPSAPRDTAFDGVNMGIKLCEDFLNDRKIIQWTKTATFDLVFLDSLYNDCGLGLAYKFGAKHAIFGTSSVLPFWPDVFGFTAESSWIPSLLFPYDVPMSFYERLMSTIYYLAFYFQKRYKMFPALELLMREKLEIPNMPPLHEIESNASLVLMNTHFSEEVARSLPPLIVPVGGIHCQDQVKPLPKEFTKFLNDGGDNGFIYVSFGSGASISKAPQQLRDVFFNAMKNSKTQFLWKWDGPRPENIPPNVFTSDWMPQQDILGHPKIKAFITHGGLLGIQEAIHHAVPMIVMPIFAEQDYNAQRVHRKGRGIALEIVGLKQSDLEDAISKILTDDSYRNTMKVTSRVFKDRPISPLDTALWWTEYVLRHEDTSFLRPLGISQTWYQRRLLDVWTLMFIAAALIIFTLITMCKRIFKFTRSYRASNKKPKTL